MAVGVDGLEKQPSNALPLTARPGHLHDSGLDRRDARAHCEASSHQGCGQFPIHTTTYGEPAKRLVTQQFALSVLTRLHCLCLGQAFHVQAAWGYS